MLGQLAALVPGAPASPTYEGVGKTVDEAAEKAHARIPKDPKKADEQIASKVVQWGRKTGGIAGVHEFYVIVQRA